MRLAWLDNTKMVAMLCVVAGHVVSLFDNGVPSFVQGLIVAFNMPLFVLLSGLTSLHGLQQLDHFDSLVKYEEKLLRHLVVPSVFLSAIEQACVSSLLGRKLWLIFFLVLALHWKIKHQDWKTLSGRNGIIVRGLIAGALLVSSLWLNMYWFLTMLMKLQMIMAVFCYLGNKKVESRILVPLSGLLLWIGSYFFLDSWTFEMCAYFVLGLVFKQLGIFESICNMPISLAVILTVVGCMFCQWFTIDYGFYSFGLDRLLAEGIGWVYIVRILVALFLSVAIVRLVYSVSNSYNWFSRMGQYTMSFYTIHVLILELLLKPNLYFDNPENYKWLIGASCAIVLTTVSYLIIIVCERWCFSRGLVLGIWKS